MARFQKGNKAAYKHGGERVVKAIQRGEPLTGEALEAYQDILDTLGLDLDALDDVERILVIEVAREGAAAELYWRAFCRAVDAGDDDGMYRYSGRLVWLASRQLRALDKLRKHSCGRPGAEKGRER